MDSKNIKKSFYSSVFIIMFSAFAGTAGMVVDGIFIGRFLGDISMAAFGLVSPILLLGNTLGGLIASGVTAVCSKKVGEKDFDSAQRIFSLSLLIVCVLSILSILLIAIFSDPIVRLLGADSELLFAPTKEYLLGLLLWIPASFLMLLMQPIMQLDNDKMLIFIATLTATVVDIVLDAVFIKVFHGGMREMALATSISYVVGILAFFIHFRKKDIIFKLKLSNPDFSSFADILVYGFPTAIQRFSGTLRTFALNKILAVIAGALALTALSVQSNMYNIFSSVGIGISMTTLTFTGVLFGEKNHEGIRELLSTSLKAAIIMNSLVMLILYFCAPFMVSLYLGNNLNAYENCLSAVRLFSLSLPFHAVSNVYVSYYQAIGQLKRSNIITFLNDFFYTFISALILGHFMGENGVYLSFLTGRVMTMITLYIIVAADKKHLPGTSKSE